MRSVRECVEGVEGQARRRICARGREMGGGGGLLLQRRFSTCNDAKVVARAAPNRHPTLSQSPATINCAHMG